MRSANRCVDGERRESPRASGGQLEDGRSGELEESTWRGRSEQGLETEGWGCESVAAEEDGGAHSDTKFLNAPYSHSKNISPDIMRISF